MIPCKDLANIRLWEGIAWISHNWKRLAELQDLETCHRAACPVCTGHEELYHQLWPNAVVVKRNL